MARRVVMGRRSSGDIGVWVSKPGHDADTAAFQDLLLDASIASEQLLMIGTGSPGSTVVLGFTQTPLVILSSTQNITAESGAILNAFVRPWPYISSANNSFISASPSAMTLNGADTLHYHVYRRAMA